MPARKTYLDYKNAVTHALGSTPSTGADSGQIVNDALQYLCALRSWKWRRGGPVTLDFVADQNYVELPSDFGEEETLNYPGSIARNMIRATTEEIEAMRSSTTEPPGFTYYYAINSGSLDEAKREEGLTVNVIELYPTPGESVTAAMSLLYYRNVDLLDADTDVPQIPVWLDFAFMLLCRSFAMTLEDDNPDNASQAMFNRILPDLIRRDTATQTRFGVMQGGLFPKTVPISPLYPTSIGDPSGV